MMDDIPMENCVLEANCSICGQYFKDPVILDCRHIFCRDCIMRFQCWKESSPELACPQCQLQNFSQNQQLDNIRLLKQLRDQAEGNSKCCQQHQEHLELFCKNNQVFVCSVCRGSEEHKGHTVIPIETAALEFKVGIFYLLYYWTLKKQIKKRRKQIGSNREVMKAHFEELHQFLKEQESFLLSRMEEMEDNIAQKKEEHINQVSKELCSLEAVIWELQEKYQQPINNSYRPPGLSSGDEICSPLVFCSCFFFSFFPFVAQVTLDPDTAHPKLIISENRKSLILGNWPRLHSHYSKRFDQYLFMLGCENFNTGRCYWEATVGSEDGWGLGVAKASVKCEGIVSLDPREGIWAMAKRGDHCTVLLPPDFPTLLMKWDLQRIRVSLNYIGDRLSFFDADRGILLVVFSGASFSEEPLHPFFWLQRKSAAPSLLGGRVGTSSMEGIFSVKPGEGHCFTHLHDPVPGGPQTSAGP
uniref:Uncharacterized protein n=1 Tax=Naja naja TaxID=35670 RepID=A0A8C6VDW6_NAJNA